MLYEYALEPALLNNWKDFRYFTEKFGVSWAHDCPLSKALEAVGLRISCQLR
jgi:hypothetical protein